MSFPKRGFYAQKANMRLQKLVLLTFFKTYHFHKLNGIFPCASAEINREAHLRNSFYFLN